MTLGKKKWLLVAAVAASLAGVAGAKADTLLTGGSQGNIIDFTNREAVFNSSGIEYTDPLHVPTVGDYVLGIAKVNDINGNSPVPLSGVFLQQVVGAVAPDAALPNGAIVLSASNRTSFTDINGNTVNVNMGPNEMFRFYVNTTGVDFENSNMQVDVSSAETSNLYMSLGLGTTGINSPGYDYTTLVVPTVGGTATSYLALNLVTNNTGFTVFSQVNDPGESAVGGGNPGDRNPNSPAVQPTGPDALLFAGAFGQGPAIGPSKTDSYIESNIFQNTTYSGTSAGTSPFTLGSSDPAFVVVPTPSAAWAGMGLIGLMGLGKLSRRSRA